MKYSEHDIIRLKTLSSSLFFTRYHFKHRSKRKFVVNWHHERICDAIDKVFSGEIKRLAIRIAPRYGKTEIAVKNTIAMGLALNPASKFIHLSYSDDLALDNSEEVRDFVQTEEYQKLYPYVQIDKSSTAKKKWYTTEGGGVYATSTGGQITGFGAGEVDELEGELDEIVIKDKFAGAIIIDDPLKADDADSEIKRERINQRFENTIRSRTNSRNTPIIIIGQALHERDLIGYLIEKEPNEWTVLNLPAIYQDENGNDCAMWEFKHTLEELYKLKEADPRTFRSQYQQEPSDEEGKLLPLNSLKFAPKPKDSDIIARLLFIDPADGGGDKLSAPFIDVAIEEGKLRFHVSDVVHSENGIEANTPRIEIKMKEQFTEEYFVEANGVGRAMIIHAKQNIDSDAKLKPFNSKTEKVARIMAYYEFVAQWFTFSESYKDSREYNKFISDLTAYSRKGTNTHKKDAIDVLCTGAEILKLKYFKMLYS